MSSTTKKPKINPESTQRVEETPTTADLYLEHDRYVAFINKDSERKKMSFLRDVESNGETYVDEIDERLELEEDERIDNIEYIYKKSKDKYGTLRELNNMDYEEVKRILFKIQETEKSIWTRLFEFFFGIKEPLADPDQE